MTYEDEIGSVWHDDGAAIATEAACDAGLAGNDADVAVLSYNGGLKPLDGLACEFSMYDGALSQVEIEALPDAVTVDHDMPSPAEFTCLARSSGTLDTSHADFGTINGSAAFRTLTTGGNARYDFTGTIRSTPLTSPPGNLTWTGKRNLMRIDGNAGSPDHDGACVSGGAFLCSNMTADHNWNALYQSTNTPVATFQIRETTTRNLLLEGAPHSRLLRRLSVVWQRRTRYLLKHRAPKVGRDHGAG